MRLSALLCWYDANPSWLMSTIASLGRVGAHRVVVSDGAYGLFPGHKPRSSLEQVEAIQLACDAADIELLMYRPAAPWWKGEPAKRDHMFKLATFDAKIGEDWLFMIDDDEVVVDGAPGVVYERLKETDALAMTASMYQPAPSWLLPDEARLEGDGLQETRAKAEEFRQKFAVPHMNGPWLQTRFFRVVENMGCEVTHYTYTGEYGGVKYALRDDALGKSLGYASPSIEHVEGVVIEHRDLLRPKYRRDSKRAYYDARNEARIETPEHCGRELVASDAGA